MGQGMVVLNNMISYVPRFLKYFVFFTVAFIIVEASITSIGT